MKRVRCEKKSGEGRRYMDGRRICEEGRGEDGRESWEGENYMD